MYYFAYGSNMVYDLMRRLCGRHCFVIGRAALQDYEIGIDLRGFANIRPHNEEQVYGVLYEVSQEAVDSLDRFEGHPNVFKRSEVSVLDEDGRAHKAWTYSESADQFGGTVARKDHFMRIISGARENRLPEKWIEKITKLMEG